MNCKDEVNRKKSYYQGLEQAVSLPLTDDFREAIDDFNSDDLISDNTKNALRFWIETVGPFSSALAYIVNNRFILEEKSNIISENDGSPALMPDEIFTTLHRLNPYTIREFLAILPIDTIVNERLLQTILSDDKETFIKLIRNLNCDLTPLSRLCQHCWDDHQSGIDISHDDDDFLNLLDSLTDTPSTDASERQFQEAAEQLYPSAELIEDEDDPNFDANLEQYFADYQHLCESLFDYYIRFYLQWHDDFQPKERKLLDPFLDHPFAVELMKQIEHEGQVDEIPFRLSDDFFDLKNRSKARSEHLHPKMSFINKGEATLTEFINYLAEQGYIDATHAAKSLFAYRLTGFCRPEGKLPQLYWCGKNGKSYELIFIVKHISERGDYKKMRQFFTGPEWVKDRDSSYALAAHSELRRALEKFYPGIFHFEKQASQR